MAVISDESIEDMANADLHVMRFLGLDLEDDVPDHSVLSRFRTRLTAAQAWDDLLEQINRQIQAHQITVTKGCQIVRALYTARANPGRNRCMKWSMIVKIATMMFTTI